MKLFNDFINSISPLSKESRDLLVALVRIKKLKKGDSIVKIGERPKDIYVLKSGVIRSFDTDTKGKEYNRQIFIPYKILGALRALLLNKPSRFSYDCLSDCEVYAVNFKNLKELIKKDKQICRFYASALEVVYLTLESKVYDLSVLNATERYIKLKKKIPNIENLIPQYHIASYLNITPVQLSRIRKKIFSK
ncbi:Crp/Fnr family transcriptional regulator [Polaribacter sp. MSW13]|uniref:Crp/Fnr family transcriptional regulator n=1 Tax=Polaribacter marinus TaxID=2916838 RepID=A0A9X1VNF9_9FLAO|nr:Crp/Fnr family transcriptional regulator [Polaribacter marinus]MCI2227650.1 Crp/Fnr family transcriptional regulator [Polaribacter marinus]